MCDAYLFKKKKKRHYPKTSFTIVADTPENLRLKQQSMLNSQVSLKGEEKKQHMSIHGIQLAAITGMVQVEGKFKMSIIISVCLFF